MRNPEYRICPSCQHRTMRLVDLGANRAACEACACDEIGVEEACQAPIAWESEKAKRLGAMDPRELEWWR